MSAEALRDRPASLDARGPDAPSPGFAPSAVPPPPGPGSRLSWVLGGLAAAAGVYFLKGLIIPIILGVLLAYLLNPLVAWQQGLGIRRSVAVMTLFGGFAIVVLGLAVFVAPRFRAEGLALIDNLPALARTLERGIDGLTVDLGEAYPAARRFLGKARPVGWLEQAIEERTANAGDFVEHAGTIAFAVVLAPVFAFFMLRDAGGGVTYLMDRLAPPHIETTVAAWCEIDRIIGRYLRGLALEALIVGALTTVGLWAIGAPYPLLVGAFTMLVNPLPYLGTILSAGLAVVVALANGRGLGLVGAIVLLYLAIRILDDLVVATLTIGGSVHLHPLVVLVSIIAGEQALGLVGMVMAVPLVTVVKEIARLVLEHRRNLARPHVPAVGRPAQVLEYVC